MTRADLRRARADLRAFSDAIDHQLTETQAESLRLERRTTVIVAPRQTGKSRSLSVLALWWAFRRAGQRVLVISAGEQSARRLLSEAAAVAMRSPLLAGGVVDETGTLLSLSNGSEVRSVPASERQVRGWSVDLLLVDECALVDDELLLGAAIPTTAARPDARIVLCGSPAGPEGAFYVHAELGDLGSPDVATSTSSPGMPSILPKTLADPPGRQVSGVEDPSRPLAASLTVPSPPKATTTS